ncbi:hypothetical protein AGDE_11247 [Angomonas deanei]|uniref:Uncharacterized protein n=1 Tax=Angomonas deanei TaxID=59799 RepID=A0A7G2CA03_9TRYP|nr:hypothetical protein AGDE_11247 [Angomonas deanei]CAD2216690.1 hypothetical protein, conserved [Angomonas deanei]|eukprot:EPY26514.1 hypothetical protein AGDE_11247 [Angomonas deanei]
MERIMTTREARSSGLTSFLASFPSQFTVDTIGKVTVVKRSAVPSSTTPHHKAAIPASEIEEYELFRVARLLPEAGKPIAIDEAFLNDAQALLPPGHDVLSVCLSAPELFNVTFSNGSYSIQFKLSPTCVPRIRHPEEELEKIARGDGDRRKRRAAQRQLAYLKYRSPFLDERVLAFYLVDILPTVVEKGNPFSACVSRADLFKGLPPEIGFCTPVDIRAFLSKFPNLFTLMDGEGTDLLIQRADLPIPHQSSEEDITAEEVLTEIFLHYPQTRPPIKGTNLFRCLNTLSPPLRRKLYSFKNVKEELLLLFPDKVELMTNPFGPPTEVDDLFHPTPHQIRTCKGRVDFFIPFRFKDDWLEKLEKKYDKALLKKI